MTDAMIQQVRNDLRDQAKAFIRACGKDPDKVGSLYDYYTPEMKLKDREMWARDEMHQDENGKWVWNED